MDLFTDFQVNSPISPWVRGKYDNMRDLLQQENRFIFSNTSHESQQPNINITSRLTCGGSLCLNCYDELKDVSAKSTK